MVETNVEYIRQNLGIVNYPVISATYVENILMLKGLPIPTVTIYLACDILF